MFFGIDLSALGGKVPAELTYVALLFALFVVPSWLQRYRVPGAITSLLMGVGATALGLFQHNETISLLSTFGIVALFLFAGLEIDGPELRRSAGALAVFGLFWTALVVATTFAGAKLFGIGNRPGVLLALALMTPSTGFILSSLGGFGLTESERFAVKTKAISAELLSLGALFFALQSTSFEQFGIATAALLTIVLFIPLAFRVFAASVAPHAPRSEFAFLLMVAVVCSYATRRLGVYYLVGAFFVGVAAQRFRTRLPAMSSERVIHALEAFGSVFIPFYFFNAGSHIHGSELGWDALIVGIAFLGICVPLRIGMTMLPRWLALGESPRKGGRVGVALVPTLVFTLVLTEILRDQFAAPGYLIGGLIIYTVVNTTLPAFALRSAAPSFEDVEAEPVQVPDQAAAAAPTS